MIEIRQGDARELVRDLDDDSVHCVITDPPYGVAFQSNFAKTEEGQEYTRAIANDDDLDQALDLFASTMSPMMDKLKADADVYVFTSWGIQQPWLDMCHHIGLDFKMPLIWEKGWPGLGDLKGNWGCGYETILYCKKGNRPVNYRRSAVLTFDKPVPSQQVHPTEKPVGLMAELIKVSTHAGDLVVDPFAGSGSTLSAAELTGRHAIGFELDEKYVASIERRLMQPGLF